MKKIKQIICAGLTAVLLLGTAGCAKDSSEVKLDPGKPVTLTIWHYYNGSQQVAFDELVSEFNETAGKEKGIYVEGHGQGSVPELEENVVASMNGEVGSQQVPDIFSSYADTAYAIEQMDKLADISQYMTEDELSSYTDSYIEEGKIGKNGELRIFPVAKSSEILMLNKTDWDKFADASGADINSLKTIEGINQTAQAYYEWTDSLTPDIPNDGRAFYGRDSMANYFIIGSMQLGTEIFEVNNGKVTLNVDKDVVRRIWDNYYVPFVKGYFASYGKFRSDDVKIGELLAFTGSTSSSMYFPDEVELENETYPINYVVLPAPAFEDGENYAVQQGAGMVVAKSTKEKEYAAVTFLKWFTEKENNMRFVCASGYLPVKEGAATKEVLDAAMEKNEINVPGKTYDALIQSFEMIKTNTLYTNKAFEGGSDARKVLEYNLSDKAAADRETVKQKLAEGIPLDEAAADFTSDKAFDTWYNEFETALNGSVAVK